MLTDIGPGKDVNTLRTLADEKTQWRRRTDCSCRLHSYLQNTVEDRNIRIDIVKMEELREEVGDKEIFSRFIIKLWQW